MKLLTKILPILLCLCLLTLPAAAVESTAGSAKTNVSVASDGSCTVQMHYSFKNRDDTLPVELLLPADAKDVRVNGSLKTPSSTASGLKLSFSDYSDSVLDVSFRLENAVTRDGDVLTLEVPLLTGLNLPIEKFEFSVTFPSAATQRPSFVSGYSGADIAGKIALKMRGASVSGSCGERLNDRETLVLRYRGDREMFPSFHEDTRLLDGWEFLLALLFAAAAVYYLAALLPRIPKKVRAVTPPEGLAAGDIGTCLTGCGTDLTMLVFSWAELGYLSVRMDARGRVRLQKRMDMGTERSEFENKAFRALFERHGIVDGSSMRYALLYRRIAKRSPLLRQIYRSRSGNPQIVRVLGVAAGTVCGVLLSRHTYTAGVGTVLLALLLAAVCGALSHLIHYGSRCIPLGNKRALWIGGAAAIAWLLLGALLDALAVSTLMVLAQLLLGLFAALGGRRSEQGEEYLAQIRGLRAHMTHGSMFDMQQCLEKNPNYFFDLMPYALALGVEQSFARRFGKIRLSECPYLSAAQEQSLSPTQWASMLRQVADCLNRRQRRLRFERLLRKLHEH